MRGQLLRYMRKGCPLLSQGGSHNRFCQQLQKSIILHTVRKLHSPCLEHFERRHKQLKKKKKTLYSKTTVLFCSRKGSAWLPNALCECAWDVHVHLLTYWLKSWCHLCLQVNTNFVWLWCPSFDSVIVAVINGSNSVMDQTQMDTSREIQVRSSCCTCV